MVMIKKLLIVSLLFSSGYVYGFNKFKVTKIYFKGLQRVAIKDALLSMQIRLGEMIDNENISNIIYGLFTTGNFEDIHVLRDGNSLIIRVKERPIIASITFSGNRSVQDDMVKKNLDSAGICVLKPLNNNTLFTVKKDLKNFYYSIGKYNATVNFYITQLSQNRVNLKLIINEGDAAKIQKISIKGNHTFSTKQLISMFRLRDEMSRWKIIGGNTYQKSKLEEDLQTLTEYYLDRGYACFNIDSTEIYLTPDKKKVFINININEGDRYTLLGIDVDGNLAGHFDEIKSFIKKINFGQKYNNSELIKVVNNIKKLLNNYGYPYVRVQVQSEIYKNNKTIKLHIHVDAGNRFYVRNVFFEGNNFFKNSVLYRKIKQMEGKWLNVNLIEQGGKVLNKLGYFETVNINIRLVPNNSNQVNVIYKVKERNTSNFNFSAGYSIQNGITSEISIFQDNWMGTGYSVGISGIKNKCQVYSDFFITNPFITDKGISVGGHVFYNEFKADNTDLSSYINKSYSIDGKISFPINESNITYIKLCYMHNDLFNMQPQVAMWRYFDSIGLIAAKDSESNINFIADDFTFNVGWSYNQLDRDLFPTKGSKVNLSGKITIPGTNNEFYKVTFDTASYLPISSDHKLVIFGRTKLGYGNGMGNKELPFYENFYAGGFNTVRGFQSNNIGPKAVYYGGNNKNNCNKPFSSNICSSQKAVGGNAMAIASLECIKPIVFINDNNYMNSSIRASIFIDAGTVWDTGWQNTVQMHKEKIPDYSDYKKIRISTGIALQWISPVGPLVFSYAQPIKIYDGDKEEPFQFSIGKTW